MTTRKIEERNQQGFVWRDPAGSRTAFSYVTKNGEHFWISNKALAMLFGFLLGLSSMAVGSTDGLAAAVHLIRSSL